MKRTISFILAALFLASVPIALADEPKTSAGACVLIDAEGAQVLYSHNPDKQMLIASTTKIMTALVVLESCDPEEQFQIPRECTGIEGSSMYLREGESYRVKDLLYGMLLASGNDAASALAVYCAGSVEQFAVLMNDKAKALGLENTSFENPHGLDGEMQYSSAYDLAIITKAAMENEVFAEIVSTKTHSIGERSYVNHNKLLWNYEGCLGVKTGYTMAAGRTLVSCAQRDGIKLICVTLSDPDDWNDHMSLYNWAFSTFEYVSPFPEGEICRLPVISGESETVGITLPSGIELLCKKTDELSYSIELPYFVYAEVEEGAVAGKIRITLNGELIGGYPLVYSESVPLKDGVKLTPWQRFMRSWFYSGKYGFVPGVKAR